MYYFFDENDYQLYESHCGYKYFKVALEVALEQESMDK